MKKIEPIVVEQSVADQILELPIGSVVGVIFSRSPKWVIEVLLRTGTNGWKVTGLNGYLHAEDIEGWVSGRDIVLLHEGRTPAE